MNLFFPMFPGWIWVQDRTVSLYQLADSTAFDDSNIEKTLAKSRGREIWPSQNITRHSDLMVD